MDPLWNSLFSGAAGAALVAIVNIGVNHRLASQRDRTNREENEKIQLKAEVRQYKTLEDHHRDATHEREQNERIHAVKGYYVAYTKSVRTSGLAKKEGYKDLVTATRIFRLEATTIAHDMHIQVTKILKATEVLDHYFTIFRSVHTDKEAEVMAHMESLQEPIFEQLMLWALDGNERKFGELMDRELAKWKI